ncbi:MAG: alpha/beta fold hydrolase [Balneolaceae bacterium]|nr:alpha/beta fold hydrolase [Balneolaceae bacterium]MCH8548028.1 alpha/beta fold hydrolase [Balneolaceae bacterium]
MRYIYITLFLISTHLLTINLVAQDLTEVEGPWRGAIEITGQELAISFLFSYSDNELDGTIDIPQQDTYNIPVEFTHAGDDSLHFRFETGTGPATFKGGWDRDEMVISGEFEQVDMTFPFSIKKVEQRGGDDRFSEENLLIPTRAGQISGSLLLADEASPLVILFNGYGSQDRDEIVAGFRVFRELSRQLNSFGYSTFRYDDRGIGDSTGESDAALTDLAADLTDMVDHLRGHHGDRFSKIILLGHSQGGLVASLAAGQTEVDGIIFMAAPFLPGDEVIKEQIEVLSEAQGIEEEVMVQNLDFQRRIYAAVRGEGSWEELESDLAERLEAQINELPEQQRAALGDMTTFVQSQVDRQLSGSKTDWFRSYIDFDPAEVTGSLVQIPMLVLFGEKDREVIEESNRIAAQELKVSSGLDMEIIAIAEANHLFQNAGSGLPNEYGMLNREFADGFISAIVEWLEKLDR